MSTPSAPAVPISRPDLIAALAGDTVCRHCAGRGKVFVANERAGRPCPMCHGTGLTDRQRPAPTRAVLVPRPDPRPF